MNDESDNRENQPEKEAEPRSSPPTEKPPAVTSDRKSSSKRKCRVQWREFRAWVTIVISFLTLMAVVWYAYIASKQRDEMVRSNNITQAALDEAKRNNSETAKNTLDALTLTRQSNEIAGRAWVLITKFEGGVIAGVRTQYTVSLRNFGKSPAIGVAVITHSEVLKSIPQRLTVGTWPNRPLGAIPGSSVLAQGETIQTPFNVGPFTVDEVRSVIGGRLFMVITGAIFYSDIFGVERQTTFCITVNPAEGRNVYCPGGNFAR